MMHLLALLQDDGGGIGIVGIVPGMIVGGLVGYFIGKSKNRAPLGAILGALLGCIGWIIIGVMPKAEG